MRNLITNIFPNFMKTPLLNALFRLFQINRPDSLQSREICWHLFRYSSNGNVVLEAEKCCYPDPMFYPPTTGPCTRLVPKSCPPLFPRFLSFRANGLPGGHKQGSMSLFTSCCYLTKSSGNPTGRTF